MLKKCNILKFGSLYYLTLIILLIGCDKEKEIDISDFYAESEKFIYDNNISSNRVQIKIDTLFFKDDTTSSFYNVFVVDPLHDSYNYQTRDVLYLLHGIYCQADCWLNMGLTDYIMVMSGSYDRMPVIIMPEAFDSYYVDGFKKEHNYESFFMNNLLPELEEQYDCGKNMGKRCIGGFSMGGYGSLYYSVKYDQMFDFAYALSGSFEGRDLQKTPPIVNIFEEKKTGSFPYIILDIGESDPFLQSNINLHFLMEEMKINHEFLIKEGGHEWSYWQENLYSVLKRIFEFINDNDMV